MKKNQKLILGILIIILISIICALISINLQNKNIIQKQSKEVEKLAEVNQNNSYITTSDHLAEVNSSVQSIWESIRNSETLSSKTDSSGNSIYGNVTDLNSLESAITADNENYFKGHNTIVSQEASRTYTLKPNEYVNLSIAFSNLSKVSGISSLLIDGYESLNVYTVRISGNTVVVNLHNCGNYDKWTKVTVKAFQVAE